VLSRRSPAYKALGLGSRDVSRAEAIDLMLKDPNLMRRPLVLAGRKTILGYAPEEYDSL